MKLYSFTGSCALAANIVLEWIGEPYTLELLQKDDLGTAEFRRLNPFGKVPTLDIDGWILYENAAVLAYLADKHPDSRLYGDGTLAGRAEVDRWLGVFNSDMHPAFKPLFGGTAYLDDATAIDKTKANAHKQLRSFFEQVDKQLEGRDWVTGSRSIVDPYLFVMLVWAGMLGVDLDGLGNLARFEQRMRADTAVSNALQQQGLAHAT